MFWTISFIALRIWILIYLPNIHNLWFYLTFKFFQTHFYSGSRVRIISCGCKCIKHTDILWILWQVATWSLKVKNNTKQWLSITFAHDFIYMLPFPVFPFSLLLRFRWFPSQAHLAHRDHQEYPGTPDPWWVLIAFQVKTSPVQSVVCTDSHHTIFFRDCMECLVLR